MLRRFLRREAQFIELFEAHAARIDTAERAADKVTVLCDLLESITDRCEDAVNVIEGIVLENS